MISLLREFLRSDNYTIVSRSLTRTHLADFKTGSVATMLSGDAASPPPLAVDAVARETVRALCPMRAEEAALMLAAGGPACARLPMFQAVPVRARWRQAKTAAVITAAILKIACRLENQS